MQGLRSVQPAADLPFRRVLAGGLGGKSELLHAAGFTASPACRGTFSMVSPILRGFWVVQCRLLPVGRGGFWGGWNLDPGVY
jgi:hypothetical protein